MSAIIGAAAGGGAFLLIGSAAGYLYVRRRRAAKTAAGRKIPRMLTEVETQAATDAVYDDYVSQTMFSSLQSTYNRISTAPMGADSTTMFLSTASPANFTFSFHAEAPASGPAMNQ